MNTLPDPTSWFFLKFPTNQIVSDEKNNNKYRKLLILIGKIVQINIRNFVIGCWIR